MSRLTGRLFVGFTLLLILFIAFSGQIFVIWPWYGSVLSIELLNLLVPFNVLVGMLLWSYYLCVVTDPGRVPDGWKPDTQGGDGYEVKKMTRGPRFCRTCDAYKPPRAHHCKTCKRCVLRMDHHCPWVNNCVGHYNYGHFIRFLFFVDVACSYDLAMVANRVYSATKYWENLSSMELIFTILNLATCIPVLLAVGMFSMYHFYCLAGNSTTIEGWEKDKVATLVRRGKIHEIKFPYNLGISRNIRSVLGDNPLLWCWPTVTPGTGLKYQLAEGDVSNAEAWPPEDPTKADTTLPEPDPNYQFKLPDSPWTYQNGTINPNLAPSSARRRTARSTNRTAGPYSSLPPYHPDYNAAPAHEPYSPSVSSESEEEVVEEGVDLEATTARRGGVRVRRGSEGYEVRAVDREEMLRRFVEGRVHEPGRYQVYAPEPESENEDDPEDVMPLAEKAALLRSRS